MKTRRNQHSQEYETHAGNVFYASWSWPFDPKINDFQDSWCDISVSSLVILAAAVFVISCGKTDRHINATANPTRWLSSAWVIKTMYKVIGRFYNGENSWRLCEQTEQRPGTGSRVCTEDDSLSTDNVILTHSCGQHSSSMEIQLAPSETKPFTRSDILMSCLIFRHIEYYDSRGQWMGHVWCQDRSSTSPWSPLYPVWCPQLNNLFIRVLYGLTSHSTHYRSFRRRFYRSDDPTNSVIALKDDSLPGQGPIPQAQRAKR